METLNRILEVGNELAMAMPLTQTVPVLVLVTLAMIWGKYKEGFWIGIVACLIITISSNEHVVMEMLSAEAYGLIAVMFLSMMMALFALFTFIHQGD